MIKLLINCFLLYYIYPQTNGSQFTLEFHQSSSLFSLHLPFPRILPVEIRNSMGSNRSKFSSVNLPVNDPETERESRLSPRQVVERQPQRFCGSIVARREGGAGQIFIHCHLLEARISVGWLGRKRADTGHAPHAAK